MIYFKDLDCVVPCGASAVQICRRLAVVLLVFFRTSRTCARSHTKNKSTHILTLNMSASTPDAASAAPQRPSSPAPPASNVARLPAPQTAGAASGEATSIATSAATVTMTETEEHPPVDDELLTLSLRARPSVRWYVAVLLIATLDLFCCSMFASCRARTF